MTYHGLARRGGKPTVVAVAASTPREGVLACGLLMVHAHVGHGIATLESRESSDRVTVRLPGGALDRPFPWWGQAVELAVVIDD